MRRDIRAESKGLRAYGVIALSPQPSALSPSCRNALLFRGRRLRRRRMRREAARPLFFVRGPDRPHRRAGSLHLHRVTRDVKADGSRHAVWFPFGHIALVVAPRNEAVFAPAVTAVFAAAITGHVGRNLGVFRGPRVRGAHNLHRSRGRHRVERKRWQVRLWMRCERDRWCFRNRLRYGGCRR